jgi:hypothetical protein
VGQFAGGAATTGSYNVFLGANVEGTAADTNTMRLGLPYQAGFGVGQNRTFIAGIRGTAIAAGEAVFIDPAGQLGSGPLPPPAANSVGSAQVVDDALTASDLAPGAVGSSELAADAVTAAKVAFPYAASTTEGGPAIDVACAGCISATEVGFTFASLGANTFSGTQTLASGNVNLAPSSSASGNLTKSGIRFLHDTGTDNTFLGQLAGNFAVTGIANTVVGAQALTSDTTGEFNVASGSYALRSNTTGSFNTAHGAAALENNVTGSANAAFGLSALNNATGSSNTALGFAAGANATTGTYNVFLGASVFGAAADTNTMRLGLPYDNANGTGQNRTFIAGIAGTVLTTPAVQVFVDANGQLGTLVPAPFSGTVNEGLTPGGTPPIDAALLAQRLEEQQRVIADLQARLAALEAERSPRARRR